MGRGSSIVAEAQQGLRRRKPPSRATQVLFKELQRTSSKGVAARLRLYHDIDDGIKEGWRIDLIELHTAEGPAGYLKISFIPKDRMECYYGDVFAFAVNYHNNYGFKLRELLQKAQGQWTREDYLNALSDTEGYRSNTVQIREQQQTMSKSELAELWGKRKAKISEEHTSEYQRFLDFHLDKPLVDFVRVSAHGDDSPYVDGQRRKAYPREASGKQGQGLAELMYQTAAIWADAQGLQLHASGVQSPEAGGVWEGFEAKGLAKSAGKRRIYNVEKLLAEQPELAWPVAK